MRLPSASPLLQPQTSLRSWVALLCISLAHFSALSQATPGRTKDDLQASPALTKARVSGPKWTDLAKHQRVALKPLAEDWNGLSEAQKRKWVALSRNFDKMSAQEQQTLQGRMREWVALSAKDRSRARLNFAETKNLSVEVKQAKWQAYQALSDSERRTLAEQAPSRRLPGAATAVQPVPTPRLAQIAVPVGQQAKLPRISAAPHLIDPNTLLPQVDSSSAVLRAAPAQ